MFRTRFSLLLILVSCGLLVASCGPGWARPQIQPAGVSVTGVSLAGLTVRVDLDVYNPNTDTLPVRSVAFDLRVGNSMAMPGHGVVTDGLAPLQTTRVSVTVQVSGPAAISAAQQYMTGNRQYTIDGEVTIEYRGMRTVDFEQSGML
jgi:LEA14-like dessication related protein